MTKGKRAALYLRVSTDGQTTDNQRRVLMEVAGRRGWAVATAYEDAGISGAKGRDKRPGFDAMLSEKIETELWLKFILLASNASVLSAARQSFGRLRGDPDISHLFTESFQEVIAVRFGAADANPRHTSQPG